MFRVHQRAILIAMLLVTPMSPSNAKEVDAGEHAAATLKQVRSWKPWLGTWEGTIKLEVFPDGLQESRTEFPLRIILDSAEVRVFVQAKDGSWRPI